MKELGVLRELVERIGGIERIGIELGELVELRNWWRQNTGNGSIGRIDRFGGNGGKNCTLFRFDIHFLRKFENVLYEPRFHVIFKKI